VAKKADKVIQDNAHIILITGNMASGKSTVAQVLAEKLPKSVHLRGDLFRRMIVSGRATMSSTLSAEAEMQLALRYQLAQDVAKRYCEAGFTVFYQDIIIGETLANTVEAFQGYPLSIFVLCPDRKAIAARESARDKTGYASRDEIDFFDRVLQTETPRLGTWLDNSDLTVVETVAAIQKLLNEATAE
jgi:cytidylate kinase